MEKGKKKQELKTVLNGAKMPFAMHFLLRYFEKEKGNQIALRNDLTFQPAFCT